APSCFFSPVASSSYSYTLSLPRRSSDLLNGDSYGLNGCLIHEENDPMIEFYDTRYHLSNDWEGLGQFVSRYYLSTLDEREVDFRSEEHTSELQSRENLVCRLLLEKKKR